MMGVPPLDHQQVRVPFTRAGVIGIQVDGQS
jgi:hypothetical protein